MSNLEDLYEILGVEKSDSDYTIKQAYKKLAIKWHPNKNQNNRDQAEAKFKELSHAYSVLADKQKRNEYDDLRNSESNQDGLDSCKFKFNYFDDFLDFTFYNEMFQKNFGDLNASSEDISFFKTDFITNNFSLGTSSTSIITTSIINGKKITKTEKTFIDVDGKSITEITNSTNDGISKTIKDCSVREEDNLHSYNLIKKNHIKLHKSSKLCGKGNQDKLLQGCGIGNVHGHYNCEGQVHRIKRNSDGSIKK